MPTNPQDVPLYRPINSPFARKWGATTPSGTPVDDLARKVEKQLGRTQPIPPERPAGSPYARQYGPSDPAGVAQSLATLRAAFSPPGTRVRKAKSGIMVPVFDQTGSLVGICDQADLMPLGSGPTPKTPPPAPAAPAPAAPAQDPVADAVAKAMRTRNARRAKVAKSMVTSPRRITARGGQ